MSGELAVVAVTAAAIGSLHALIGPDHYLPFIAMGRARAWSLRRTLGVAAACGVGHVLGSLMLGAAAILLGWAVTRTERIEALRGDLAAWLLLGFGLGYAAWGVRHALRNRPHSHWHLHGDGTAHHHRHVHAAEHAHVHAAPLPRPLARRLTPWVLFTIFVFGPCEPLLPLLMVPAAEGSGWGVGLVAAIFAAATLVTMLAAVTVGYLGLSRFRLGRLERYSHALAGLALVACGLALKLGM